MGLLLLGGGATRALANGKNGPENAPPNAYGLCTAAANGNKTGWDKHGVPRPFTDLENNYLEGAAAQGAGDTENASEGTRRDIVDDCNQAGITPGGQGHGAPSSS